MEQHKLSSARAGRLAERQAESYLIEEGLELIARNIRYPCGEIDLLMRDDRTLVFVEVRQRSNRRFPSALASVDCKKQRRLTSAAALVLQSNNLPHFEAVRFDVVGFDASGKPLRVHWVKQAFDAQEH